MKKIILLPIAMLLQLFSYAASITLSVAQPACNNNGILNITVSGVTAPFTIQYYSVNGNTLIATHTITTGNTDVLTGYTGEVIHIQAFNSLQQSAFTQIGLPPFNVITTSPGGICPALGTLSATITPGMVGTAPFACSWSTLPSNTLFSTANPVTNVPNGNYQLTVTDATGCSFTKADSSLSIYNYSNIYPNITTTDANCTNGTATINSVSGGTPPFSYLWSNGSNSTTITGLTMGFYYLTTTDVNGCSNQSGAYVNQTIQFPVMTTVTNATCLQNDGAAIAFGSGGQNPYTYTWSNGQNTQSITGLSGGQTYNVIAHDANGCIGSGNAYVGSTTPINVTYATTPSSCSIANGGIVLTINGGTAPYTTTWNTGQTGATLTGLAQGVYSFNITDAVGCVRSGSVYVPFLYPIYLNPTTSNVICPATTGSVAANVSGGVPPFTYSWSNGSTNANLTGVSLGNYTVTVTDNVGCQKSASVYLHSTSPVHTYLTTTNASCIYSHDGSATATSLGGTPPYTYHWFNGTTGSTINSLAANYIYAYASDANGCPDYAYSYVGYNPSNNSCYCTLTGTVYNDANGNCIKDAGEVGIPNIQIHCSGFGYTYTDANGDYYFQVPTGSYTLSESVQTIYPLASCQNNSIAVNSIASGGCTITNNFANTIQTIHDLHISNWDYNQPVPGNVYAQQSIITNLGTVNEPNILAGYNNDGQIGAANFSPSTYFSTGSSANWYTTAAATYPLNYGASSTHIINYNIPTNIPMGTNLVFKDSVAYTAPIANWLNDYTPWNNVNYFTSTVVSSYDPNFKEVSPKGKGVTGNITKNDSVLEYMVHFQNLGTYYAQNVIVLDSLDSDLDWSTMKPIYQSHPCTITINDLGVAKFSFKNIHLSPESYNDGLSTGLFTYTIKQKKNLALGTQIKNSASVYFDYNDPIKTNTTLNTIVSPTEIGNNYAFNKNLKIYPNPAQTLLNIEIENAAQNGPVEINLYDLTGRLISTKNGVITTTNPIQTIDVNTLTPGMYFIKLKYNNETTTSKFTKL